jgi:hypothetical protein
MKEAEKPKKPKKYTAREIIDGLKSGRSYLRPYTLEAGMIEGVERLIPIAPNFTRVRHECEGGHVCGDRTTKVGIEPIDEDLRQIIGPLLGWVQF